MMYKIEELENEEDANNGLSEMDKLSRQFRHLHVELKKKLAEKYVEHFPDYEKICDKIVTFTKDVRRKLTTLKNDKNVDVATVDVETLISKIDQFRICSDVRDAELFTHISEIDNFISRCEEFIQDYHGIMGNLKLGLPKEIIDMKFRSTFNDYLKLLNEDMKVVRSSITVSALSLN